MNASPAPVVSTTRAGLAASLEAAPPAGCSSVPPPPRVTTTAPAPAASSASTPPSCSSSVALGVIAVAAAINSAGSSRAGAGFSTTRQPRAAAATAAATTDSSGISRQTTSTASSRSRAANASVTIAGLTAAFAPGMTAIEFSPASSTRMIATPVGPSTVASPLTSMPLAARSARAASPQWSDPTAPMKRTRAPSAAAAEA